MGASMNETSFLVMTRPFTLAAIPFTSTGPLGRLGEENWAETVPVEAMVPASSSAREKFEIVEFMEELKVLKHRCRLGELPLWAGGLQAGKPATFEANVVSIAVKHQALTLDFHR